ncbi:hypothetical protein BDP27DRAFT_1377942, partial [Rhodocollybia butyracea]
MEFDLGSALEAVERSGGSETQSEEWDDIEPDCEIESMAETTAIQPPLLPAPSPCPAFDFLPKFLRLFFGSLEDLPDLSEVEDDKNSATVSQDDLVELKLNESSVAPAEANPGGGESSTAAAGSRPAELMESQRAKKRRKTS